MKKIIALVLVMSLLGMMLTACGGTATSTPASSTAGETSAGESTAAEKLPSYNFQLGYNTVEDSVRGVMANTFKEYVEKTSNGRITVDCFSAGTLGSESEMTEMVKLGTLDFSLPGISNMSTVDPSFSAISLPFLVKDFEEGHALLDGNLGNRFKEIAQNYGYKILSFGDLGMAQITNNKRAINSVDDMAGIKMRSPNEAASIKTFESMGCSVATVAFSELYLGLSQGVVDGQFNPLDAIYQQKFYEVQDYLAITNIFYYAINFIMNDEKFAGYDAETQKILLDGALAAQEAGRAYASNADATYLEKMQGEFKEITTPDTAPFAEKVSSVYDNFAETADSKIVEIVKDIRG
ncbi:MAG: TRAP transporter substrate-binding protein [Acidithiobacillus sp.]|nr:TRAP transporter substrate-binding protein [Oscillospiraceae bacterium MB24-C1]